MILDKEIVRTDAEDKLNGKAKYTDDLEFKDMLFAKTFRSTEARAQINSISYPSLPEGYFIVDKNDVPGKNRVKIVTYDQPFFAEDQVNYIGEPIALVVGKDKEIINRIISEIKVEYEKIKPIFTIEEGINTDNPIYEKSNYFGDFHYSKNDLENIKNHAKYVVEGDYFTGYQEQAYLEPQGIIGNYINERIEITGSMQCPYYVKSAVEECMDFSSDKVRIIQATTGGGFGGKEDIPSLLGGQIACASYKARKPVKMIFERDEDIQITPKRHPSAIHLKSYIDENFKIIGMEADIKLDGGPYCGLSTIVLQRTIFAAIGVYNVPNVFVRGRAVATNNVISGAFRGFGAPQAFFALESHMEKCATKLNLESLEFKKLNLMEQFDKSSTNGIMRDKMLLKEMIERVEVLSDYSKKRNKFRIENINSHDVYKGIGISLFFHGGGFTGSGEKDYIQAKVKLKKDRDNKVHILISNVEMGQGVHTTMKKIVSEVLNISIEDIIYNNPDTDFVPDSGPTVASRTIMIVGKLVQDGAVKLKEIWISNKEQEILTEYKHPDGYSWDGINFIGDVYNCYSWGVNVVEVSVDAITYQVKADKIWAIYDIGKAIDELVVRGQIEGGIIQGLGYGGLEVMESHEGKIKQRSITDYIIPTSKDIPKIISELMNVPYEYGPFGAKGLGELTIIGTAPAYASAIAHALGIEINKIPVKPEDLLRSCEK